MYFETSLSSLLPSRTKDERAILESPNIRGSGKSCTMKFYYHMYGSDTGSLLVFMLSDTTILLKKNITGEQGNQWRNTTVTFDSSTDYRVHIVATYGNGFRGDIAIDDISFSGCSFSSRKDNGYCSNREDLPVDHRRY